MSSDIANSTPRSDAGRDEKIEMIERWQLARRRQDDVDRHALVESICSALVGGPVATLDVAAAAATFGAAYAVTGQTMNGLVEELDQLEAIWLEHVVDRRPSHTMDDATERDRSALRASLVHLHAVASTARRAATAAFGHASATAARKRIRLARHDIANATGAVRNAVVLLEDAATDDARKNFHAIAKRNSFAADALVRLHLSDRVALSTAIGWQDLSLSDFTCISAAGEGGRTPTDSSETTNVGALDAIVSAVRAAFVADDTSKVNRVTTSVARHGASTGLLTIRVLSSDDKAGDLHAIESIRQLSDALGLALQEGSSLSDLRVTFPLSAGNERHDLGGAGEGYHTDSVRF